MPSRFEMEKPKTAAEKMQALKYSVYAVKLIHKTAPLFMPLAIVSAVAYNFFQNFVQGVLFLKTMLQIVTEGGSFRQFALALCVFVAAGFLAHFFDTFGEYIYHSQAKVVYKRLNEMIFAKASEADMKNFDDPKFFDIYKRATEVVTNDQAFSFVNAFAWMLSEIITAAAMVIYVATVDPRALIVLIAAVIAFAVRTKANHLVFEKENAMTANRRVKAYVQRVVFLRDYAKDVRTSGIFGIMKKRFIEATESNKQIIRTYGKKIAAIQIVANLMGEAVPIAGTYSYAAYGYVNGVLKVADFSVLMTAISRVKGSINRVAAQFSYLQQVSLYFGNFCKFMELEPTMQNGERIPGDFESLEFRDVSFTYPGAGKPSLMHINMHINKKETIAVVGKNGAGKSTFVKLLLRFYDPDEGEILYNGVNLKEYDVKELRRRFGTVFQDYKVFALSVNENVLCRECETQEDRTLAEKSLKNSGVYEKIATLPAGADTVLTREFDSDGAGLSGGEQQKVAAARMFAHAFDFAVLDEPSSALDPIAEYKMYEALIAETRDKAVIYISHRLSSAVLSDRIYVFSDGGIAEHGAHRELMEQDGIYAEMFRMQASSYTDTQEVAKDA